MNSTVTKPVHSSTVPKTVQHLPTQAEQSQTRQCRMPVLPPPRSPQRRSPGPTHHPRRTQGPNQRLVKTTEHSAHWAGRARLLLGLVSGDFLLAFSHGENAAFCSRRPRKITPPPLPAPLKPIEFSALKPPKNAILSAQAPRRAGFACFAPQNRQNARKAACLSAFLSPNSLY